MASAKSLQRLCRQTLPLMLQAANGREMMGAVREVVATDRWNSFDRFHETTATLVRRYEAAGARTEVEAIQTGGRIGSGRWIIQEAADVQGATVRCGASSRGAGAGLAGQPLAPHPMERSDATGRLAAAAIYPRPR